MDKNYDLYCASLLMFSASEYLQKHDKDFSDDLLDRATEYIKGIKIDQDLIDEVNKYVNEIKESIERDI
jgi:hypothetical protein